MIKARFYGSSRLPYFEGWYLKQQNGRDTVALIPAIHIDRRGGCSFFVCSDIFRRLQDTTQDFDSQCWICIM